jgi:hypothetical protein
MQQARGDEQPMPRPAIAQRGRGIADAGLACAVDGRCRAAMQPRTPAQRASP